MNSTIPIKEQRQDRNEHSTIPRKEQRQDRKDHERKEDNIEIESYIKQNGNCRANLTHVAEEFGWTK